MIFITADQHIGHANCIKFDNLPFSSVYEMNDYILTKWNSIVKPDDNVLHLGDFFCGDMPIDQKIEFVSKLNGKIILIKGNHDKRDDEFYINEFEFLKVLPFYYFGKYFFCHYPIYIDDYFDKRSKEEKEIIMLLREVYNESKCEYVFHGHSHNPKTLVVGNHYNCVANKHDFTPFNVEDKINELNWK